MVPGLVVRALTAAAASLAILAAAGNADAQTAASEVRASCIRASDDGQVARDGGKLRAARAAFLACSKPECPKTVRVDCNGWLEGVQKSLPTVVVTAVDDTGVAVTAARLWFDGEKILDHLTGTAVAVDPGEHMFYVEYGGGRLVEQRVIVREGEHDRPLPFKLPLHPPKTATPPAIAAAALANPAEPPESPAPLSAPAEHRATKMNYILGGTLGAAGLAAGAAALAFEVELLNTSSSLEAMCPHKCGSTPALQNQLSSVSNDRIAAVVSLGGSIALLGAATTILVVRPFRQSDAAAVSASAFDLAPGLHGASARWTLTF